MYTRCGMAGKIKTTKIKSTFTVTAERHTTMQDAQGIIKS